MLVKFMFTLCVVHAHKHLSPSYEIKDLVPVVLVRILCEAPRGSFFDSLTQKKYPSKCR